MAESIKVLGQAFPAATTLVPLYTVPASTSTTCSSLAVCNHSATPTSVRVSVAVANAADDPKQYVFFDTPTSGNNTITATIGMTLNVGDVVRVQSASGTVSFNLFGVEIS